MAQSHRLTHRPFAGPRDLASMQALVRDRYAAALAQGVRPHDAPWYPSPSDLAWQSCITNQPNLAEVVELWFEGETLLGFVWHSHDEAEITLQWHARELYPLLLEWAEQRALQAQGAAADDKPATLSLPVFARDLPIRALLGARGYAQTTRTPMLDHLFDLTGALPARPLLPAGFSVRALAGAREIGARVSVHRAAFAPSRMTAAKHLCAMHASAYRPDLDLVVQAPGPPPALSPEDEGNAGDLCFAAFALVWYDEANRRGVFEPVGCRPEFQRRGLASALLIEGMHRLQALGATHAWIGAWGDSPGAKTYQALGGIPAQQHDFFTRTLVSAPSAVITST